MRPLALAALFAAFAVAPLAAADKKADEKKADDTKKAEKKPAAVKETDWTNFVKVNELTAEVVKVDGDAVTVRVGGATVTGGRRPTVKEQHQDYVYSFADGGLVRWHKMPPKLDEKGNKVAYTSKEIEAQALPVGAPGRAADRGDLVVGHIVTLVIVRPRDVPAAKATDSDLRIKYAIIQGTDPNPPKDEEKKPEPKKKK